ncbi:MAG TPA: hypothetical protein DCP32_03195 [Anaerolineaceae bacterium]|nr:MAG: hypothetical protein A2X24_03160 [Chloroflexi bacterium GWB2_54_36]HAL15779.1 hypothetical protein [Anaerolineaceae bacterium]HBA91003.1 hypothetical protein [Anaerolineaceae bacterium]
MNRNNVIAAVWLIGLGILFLIGYIWPGILILIGITMIVNTTMRDEPTIMPPTTTLRQAQGTATSPMVEPADAPSAEPVEARVVGTSTTSASSGQASSVAAPYEPPSAESGDASTSSATAAPGEPLPAVLASAADRLYLASQLPEKCPACDAPMRANAEKLEWHEDNSVSCTFCGYRLTVKAG